MGWIIWGWNPGWGKEILFLQNIQTSYVVHLASYSMGNQGSFPAEEWLWHKDDHSPLASAEVKNERSYTSPPHTHIHDMDKGKSVLMIRRYYCLSQWHILHMMMIIFFCYRQ